MPSFVDLTATPHIFFKILPEDWAIEIAPIWDQYANGSKIYGIKENDKVVAGGILFDTVSPDTQAYRDIAQSWLNTGALYIGFLFVSPDQRGRKLGTRWIEELRLNLPNQKFWLAIEDLDLIEFYKPLGFSFQQEVNNEGTFEWILTD